MMGFVVVVIMFVVVVMILFDVFCVFWCCFLVVCVNLVEGFLGVVLLCLYDGLFDFVVVVVVFELFVVEFDYVEFYVSCLLIVVCKGYLFVLVMLFVDFVEVDWLMNLLLESFM